MANLKGRGRERGMRGGGGGRKSVSKILELVSVPVSPTPDCFSFPRKFFFPPPPPKHAFAARPGGRGRGRGFSVFFVFFIFYFIFYFSKYTSLKREKEGEEKFISNWKLRIGDIWVFSFCQIASPSTPYSTY